VTGSGAAARRRRGALLAALSLSCLAAAPDVFAGRRPSALAASRPDRTLFLEAQQSLAVLKSSRARRSQRAEWDKAVVRFRKVVVRYPQSGYCDDALLAIADLQREMAARFKLPKLKDEAASTYRTLVREYPSSKLGERALFANFEIAAESAERQRISEAANAYLDAFPEGARAKQVKSAVARRVPQPEAPLPTPPPPGLAQVYNLRFWSGESSTRIVLDVEKEVRLKYDRLQAPERLWIDLHGTRLHPNLKERTFPVGDGLLAQVRIGQNKDSVVRVVLDFKEVKEHSIFYLQDPVRLVIDVRGKQEPRVAAARPTPELSPAVASPAGAPQPASASPRSSASPAPAASTSGAESVEEIRVPQRRITGMALPASKPEPPETRASAPRVVLEGNAPVRQPEPPRAPQANRAGSYSLARQLGLGARRIVIDAGHGGHDPGSIGRGGLQEKDLVLDVALRLDKLIRNELGAEVVLTRPNDVFVPLEERTAIANAKGADLFLSIHANSARNPRARGIETYFLSFAKNAHAEAVAARENAISAATLKDLQNLVKAIALNSKIDESRDFAACVQESLVRTLKPRYDGAVDRGVHSAPFYVLIGANMPSILAEIAFVSHPQEEKLLKSAEYRALIAKSLLGGVRTYLEALNRTQTLELTASGKRTKVAEGAGR
jgi:N-acetylmuramoyl-L-alanine amidase